MTTPESYIDPFEDDGDVWEGDEEAASCSLENPEVCESCQ